MWNRAELKSRGKAAFTKNYWKCVLVGFIITLLTGMGSMGSVSNFSSEDIYDESFEYHEYYEYDEGINVDISDTIFAVVAVVAAITAVISLVVGIFIANPMEIGVVSFCKISYSFVSSNNFRGILFSNSTMIFFLLKKQTNVQNNVGKRYKCLL